MNNENLCHAAIAGLAAKYFLKARINFTAVPCVQAKAAAAKRLQRQQWLANHEN